MVQFKSSAQLAGAVLVLAGVACHPSSATPGHAVEPPVAISPALAGTSPSQSYAKPPVADIQQKLTRMQFEVTQHEATEPPFHNEYWDNHARGIYVDVVTGEPLFSSVDKFESGTGWPSFTRPIEDGRVVSKTDDTLGMSRTEVRSRAGDSHLGHVFDDGPAPTGQRYCINSASLRFIPEGQLETLGYGTYAARFRSGAVATAPPSTSNACASPRPGERAGCETTFDTAVLSGTKETANGLRSVAGVLEVEPGETSGAHVVRVVYDPKQVSLDTILGKWFAAHAKAPSGPLAVFSTSKEQRQAVGAWIVSRGKGFGTTAGIAVKDADLGSFSPEKN